MDFSIAILSRQNDSYWRCLEDITYPLQEALSMLGYSTEILHNKLSRNSVNIIFGLQDMPQFPIEDIPENSILYNFEQLTKGSKALRPHYIESLCKFTVWDYSERNIDVLKRNFNITKIHHVPLGYSPKLTCLDENYPKDIDVLFYGVLHPRRRKIIQELRDKGLNVKAVERVFGHERNFLIARSKIVLNIHYYTPGIFEEVRTSFLFANKKTIVSERNKDTTVPSDLEGSCVFAPYDSLVETVAELLNDPVKSAEQGEKGFECFSNRRYDKILADAAHLAVSSPSQENSFPARINAGSGKDFKEECLNVDIDPAWNPDILLDLSSPLSFEETFKTQRFGEIMLPENYFEEIVVNDVLEHVPDVICTMNNFMKLLRLGGELVIQVPYDLSYGAWQDPTHVRAFNEMSLRYYTEWSWYVGWRDFTFTLKELSYTPSDLGSRMYKNNQNINTLLKTPRAIDSMVATLVKRKTTIEEQRTYDLKHRTFYKK